MKLAASVICRNELGRYLELCIDHLLEFVDEIRILDDASDDGTSEWLTGRAHSDHRIQLFSSDRRDGAVAFTNHAAARNRLLAFTLAGEPTHILAIDADEFIDDGSALRTACEESGVAAWHLCLEEVWDVHADRLEVRQDGGWKEHDVAMLWRPDQIRHSQIVDRGHATGRVPAEVARGRTGYACVSLLHFGWANKTERADRFQRYAVGDGGRFHARRHIDSIMWPPERVILEPRDWPPGLAAYKGALLERANPTSEGASV